MWFSVDLKCDACEYEWDDLVKRDEKDEVQLCPRCNLKHGHRIISKPNVTRKSYVDGTKRKGLTELKQAAKLEQDKANLPHDKRGEIQKEINRLKKL